MGKREISQLQSWMRQMDFNALGIQTRPFAAHSAHFVLIFLHLLHFHTGKPFLITPANNGKGEISQLKNGMR